jgi:ribosomal protein S3AE
MAKATRAVRGKKKHWLKIYSGKPFNEQVIGETLLADSSSAIGKPLKVNLMNLTGNIKNQNTNIQFVVDNVSEGKAHTKVHGYEMISAALKRLIRRRSSKIDMSFDAVTSDGVKIRIKPFLLTRNKANNSVLNALRKTAKENVIKTISNTGYQNIIQDLVNHRFQVNMKKQLSKIYPIKIFEIKFLKTRLPKKEIPKVKKAPKVEEKPKAKPAKKEVPKKLEEKKPEKETKDEHKTPEKEPKTVKEAVKEKAAPEKEPKTVKKELEEKAAPEKEPKSE